MKNFNPFKLIISFTLLIVASCFSRRNIYLEPILVKYDLRYQYDSLGNRRELVKERIIVTPIIPYTIALKSIRNRIVNYTLEGNYSSQGLNATGLNAITDSSIIKNDTLFIYHKVLTKGGLGKEGANIIGYNFRKDKSIKIPKTIKKLKIEMIEIPKPNTNLIVSDGVKLEKRENPFLHINQKMKYAQLMIDL